MQFRFLFWAVLCQLFSICTSNAAGPERTPTVPPEPEREFRGIWIAVVANIDWPSKFGLSTDAQKAELVAILDRAVQLRLNAVIFQVRPQCDAVYASPFEPWSEYLTGTMGKAPQPFYDPLAFAVEEAHRRGLELHAWFNPYRALHSSHLGAISPDHVSRTHPSWVKKITTQGKPFLWLDPGERDVQDFSVNVILDVVKRYDVDGVQIDDYFYPDQDPTRTGPADFPDEASWKKFGAGGKLNRGDWRRQNVNQFVERVYRSIKATKPWVKFGVSPAGIWRPGNPLGITGQDAYARHFADTRKWLANGWVDNFSPQLYWSIEDKSHSFPVLLKWWLEQNPKGRHVWPVIAAFRAAPSNAGEVPQQIQLTRTHSSGYLLYNTSSVMRNAALAGALERVINTTSALVPASPWLGSPPGKPTLTLTNGNSNEIVTANWQPTGKEIVRLWVLQTRTNESWTTEILPANKTSRTFHNNPAAIVVTAVDRVGNLGPPAVVAIKSGSIQSPPPSSTSSAVPKKSKKKLPSPREASR